MKVVSLWPALAAYTLFLYGLLSSDNMSAIAGSPVNGSDVMAAGKMATREACRRWCWYRKLCTSFSFCSACQGDINCLLHSSYLEDDGTPTKPQEDAAWETDNASSPFPGHPCAPRHCGPDRTCVPVAQGDPLCLPQPAHCDLADAPPGARLNVSSGGGGGTSSGHDSNDFGHQGQVAQVLCLPDYVLVPPDADVNVSCQVNSKWTRFKGQCVRVAYTSPKMPLIAPLPWPIRNGSGLCVRGHYGSKSISKIALAPRACEKLVQCEDYILFRLVTRLWALDNSRSGGIFWRQSKQTPFRFLHKGNLTYQTGDTVAYSLEFLTSTIRVSIRSTRENHHFNISTSGEGYSIQLADATHLYMVGSLSLGYVNVVEKC